MQLSPVEYERFEAERNTLVDQISDMLWDSDVFRELSMNLVPMKGTGVLGPTDAQMNEHINACSEVQAEMIGAVIIELLKKNNNFA